MPTFPTTGAAWVWNGATQSFVPATPGVVDGSNAPAGNVGEYVESFNASAVPAPVSATGSGAPYVAVTTMSLSAGDWDVMAIIEAGAPFAHVANIIVTMLVQPTITSGWSVVQSGEVYMQLPVGSANFSFTSGLARFSQVAAGNATLCVNVGGSSTDIGQNMNMWGFLRARRVR